MKAVAFKSYPEINGFVEKLVIFFRQLKHSCFHLLAKLHDVVGEKLHYRAAF